MVFQERTYSVLVVSASDKFNSSIMALLPVTDYWPVNIAKSISEAKRKLLDTPVDMDFCSSWKPPSLFGT